MFVLVQLVSSLIYLVVLLLHMVVMVIFLNIFLLTSKLSEAGDEGCDFIC
jgi:hypothetical protein